MQDDRSLSPRMRSPAGKATDPHPSGTAPDDATEGGARKGGKKAPLKLLSPSRAKVSPKGKAASSSGSKRKIPSGSCGSTAKNTSQATSSSAPPSGNEIQSFPEATKGKAARVRSCSNDSTTFENSKRRSLSAENAAKIKNANISKIIDQVIEAGKVISSKHNHGTPPHSVPKKERGRPPKKVIKVGDADTVRPNESSSQSVSSEKIAAVPRKYSSSPLKSPKTTNSNNKSPNKDRNKSTSLSPRRLKKGTEGPVKKETNSTKSDVGSEETKSISLVHERMARSIERVLLAINRDDYKSVFMNVKAKEIPKFKNFKKPKNHIKKNLKEKSMNLNTEGSESEQLTEIKGGGPPPSENVSSKGANESLPVEESPSASHRKRGRPKGSKNKEKWDEHGNKIISKSMKKLLKKTLSTESNVPKPSVTKMEGKNMPIKKRNYNHLLLSSAEDEADSSCEKKKPVKAKLSKLNKKLNSKPSKVISSVVSKNKAVKLKRRLTPEIKSKKKKSLKLKSDFTSSDSDGNEDRKPSPASTPNKGRFPKSKAAFSSDSEEESDTKYNLTPRKKLIAKTSKSAKKAKKGKDFPKVKLPEKNNKVKNVIAKKEILSDSMSGSDMEDRPIKPPKKALKDKWSREERRSSRATKAEVKIEDSSHNEKKPPAKNASIRMQNRMNYFEFDDSDVEAETSEDDDDGDDEPYVSKCTVKEKKCYKPSANWKMKKNEMYSPPPKRVARMASLNAIAMMACMNEDAKVSISSLSPCKEPSMALVVKESTIARTHSDVDDDSDSELEPPPLKRENKRNSDHLSNVTPKRKKRRGELDVQMDMKDMVVTKRMASLNASAIMAASFSLEPRHKKVSHISGGQEVTNVDIKQEISYKSTKSQSSKTSSVITVEETTKKVKKAQCSRGTELEEHIIVKKRVKRQREVTVDGSDRENGNVSDNIELDHEILPKAADDSGMIVESTITYVSTQTHTAPQSVTLSGVSKYCISSTDGKTTTVVQQVQRKSTTTTNGAAPPTSASSIPTALIPPIKHVQVTQSESTLQNARTTPNYSPLGALEVMQPTMHPPPPHHPPPPPHFLNYTPPHHHMQHGISVAPIHHSHHPHLHPPHIAHHHHIASAPYPPLSPHSPPYPPPPRTSTPSSSPVCSTTPPSTTVPSQPSLPCHPSSSLGYKSSSPSGLVKPNNSSNFHSQNKISPPVDSQKQGGPSIPTSSPNPHFREERNRPPMVSSTAHSLPNGPSERHHSAFTAPTPTHSPGYQPVSGPMPLGGGSSANGSYKPLQASPGSTPPYSSPSRLTSPPSPSNKPYQPPNPEHYPPHPYQPYPYPPSSYDKYYHPRATAYHLYQSPYPGGQYLAEQGSPEYGFHPPPSGTVHYSQESYTSYTLCVPGPPPPHGSQLPPHPQTLALPPPPTSNASPHHHQNPPYTTYQYTEFNPGYPYPPAGTIVRINFLGPPPNLGCCPPNSKNGPSGSLTGGGKGPEGDCRGKNQIATPGSCNNYQYYMSPHPSHPNQPSTYQNPAQAHNAMGHVPLKQYNYPQVESHRERGHHNHQQTSVAPNSCNKVNSSDPSFPPEGQNNSTDAKVNSFVPLPQRGNTKPPPTKNNDDNVSNSSLLAVVTTAISSTSSSISTSTSISSPPASTPLLAIVVTQPSASPSIAAVSSSESSDDLESSKEKKDNTQTVKNNTKSIASSACGNNEIAVPNGKSTLQITTWVVPQSASPVAPSSNSCSAATGVSSSHNMLFSPTSTTTSISLPHPFASTNSVMSTTVPVVTSLEKLPLDNSKPKISIATTNCNDSSIVSDSELPCKESKTNSSLDSCNKDQIVKKIATSSQRTGGRHLLCQPLPLNHSKTTSVLAKVKPSIIKSHLPVKASSISEVRKEAVKLDERAVKSPSKLLPSEREEKVTELKNLTDNDREISKDDECPVVPRKRGRPPKLKEPSSEIIKDGICRNGVALETKPFLKAPGDVNSREDKVPRKRMSLLKSSGAKNALAVPNSNLKRSKSFPSQDIPILKGDLKPVGELKMINVKTEVLGKIKAEKVSPKNVSLKESGRLKFINGEEDLKSQSLQSKEFNTTFMPPPLGFDCETQEAFERKISKLKSEEIEIGDSERKLKRKSNDSERPGSKSPFDKNGKNTKVNIYKGSRLFKHGYRQGFNGVNSKVRRKASLLAYLKEKNNESDTSVGETECPPSPNKEGKLHKPHPFVNYSPSPGALRGRRASGTGKGKQIRKLKPCHGWSWDGEAHEGKIWLRNDEENMVRTCYKAMKHKEGDMIRVRDCVLLRSGMKKTDLPYVAKVAALWEDPDTSDMMMSILWYYRPEHTECGRREEDLTDEIFASKHRDHLSVACIEDRCYVLTFNEYCRYRRLLRLFQEKVHPMSSPVPSSDDGYFRKERQPPGCVVQDLLFFCRKVYDYRQKRILKNPC